MVGLLFTWDVLHFWFIMDDPLMIVSATDSLRDILLAHKYSYAFYTPLEPLSFIPDVRLFGMSPFMYHVHNLLILVAVAFMVYLVLSLYTGRVNSFVAAVIVLLSPPSLLCVIWISLRQYLYGALFSLGAVYWYVRTKPRPSQNIWPVMGIMILCELSFLSKEQFMSLPLGLVLLSEGGVGERIKRTYPYLLLLVAHFLLRWYVLGGMGGYVGAVYEPGVIFKTSWKSVLMASQVIFGSPWVIFLAILPLLAKPGKLLLSVLLWVFILSISFLAMYSYPAPNTYRYWFLPAILISFLIGFSADYIRNVFLRSVFLSVILVVLIVNSLTVGRDLKNVFRQESEVAGAVSRAMVDRRYDGAVILFPETPYFNEISYIYFAGKAYRKLLGARIYPVFYPREWIKRYPEIAESARSLYAIRGGTVTGLSGGEAAELVRPQGSKEKPDIKVSHASPSPAVDLHCHDAAFVTAFSLRKVKDRYFLTQDTVYYAEHMDLKPYFERVDIPGTATVRLLPREMLTYHEGEWRLGQRTLSEDEPLITCYCTGRDGKSTALSDILDVSK